MMQPALIKNISTTSPTTIALIYSMTSYLTIALIYNASLRLLHQFFQFPPSILDLLGLSDATCLDQYIPITTPPTTKHTDLLNDSLPQRLH